MKKVIALLLASVMMLSLTSCGKNEDEDPLMELSKEELIEMYYSSEADKEYYIEELDKARETIVGIQGEETQPVGVTTFSATDERLTLWTQDGVIELPVEFKFPYSTQTSNTSSINISEKITIKPSSNWDIRINGTEVDLYHTGSAIRGVIKVAAVSQLANEQVTASDLQDTINEFFTNMPPETISYNKLFVNGTWVGMNAQAHTFIDTEDSYIVCGMLKSGDSCVTYMFIYEGEYSSANNELILNLMKSMTLYGNALSIE
jgi:hypothetical protein